MNKRIDLISLRVVRERSIEYESFGSLLKPKDVFELVKRLIGNPDREHALVIALNNQCEPTAIEIVSIGTNNGAFLYPRDVMRCALMSNAVSILLVHTHPSNNVKPSIEDKMITKRIYDAGVLLNIELVDHIIIGLDKWYSMKSKGFFRNIDEKENI